MSNWCTAETGNHQGLVICEETGRNVAVCYDKSDAPLVAAAPALLAAARMAADALNPSRNSEEREALRQLQNAIAAATPEPAAPPYDPAHLTIERKRFSVTQGEVLLTYAGERLDQYGDSITLQAGAWCGLPDSHWQEAAARILRERGVVS